MDVVSVGTPVREFIFSQCFDPSLATTLTNKFGISDFLDRSFRKLSTGETRKVMLIRSLSRKPDLLIFYEPFDGLDANSLYILYEYLDCLFDKVAMVMVLNQFDEIPRFITHFSYMEKGELVLKVNRADEDVFSELYHLIHLKNTDFDIPLADLHNPPPQLDPIYPLVRLKNVKNQYGESIVSEGLNWTIEPGQHWQLSGPNGSGKTGILSLITGNHPQCYVNDIFFGGLNVVMGKVSGKSKSILDMFPLRCIGNIVSDVVAKV
ncbi:ATP-binding cassette domain-containing protein [Marinobacterium litorale]|uniref:ATP-binding cassette domain-containing protein n=1 Tax=Marinobacterium litorale TaxID=404770 RepID=UPI001FDEF247|nr:ATP-binding cassette domain-containing protein [Marinobacterium litorale]